MTTGASPLRSSDKKWSFAGIPVENLLAEFGSPLFAYDSKTICTHLASLRAALPPCVDVYYSIKANPNPEIARLFVDKGAGLEIASGAEYLRARAAGAGPDRILFAGPGKTEQELQLVTKYGIGEIHVESLEELELLESLERAVNVSVRFNPSGKAGGGAMRMGGTPSQFGFDEEILPGVVDRIKSSKLLHFCGLHMFAGTQLLDVGVLVAQWRHAIGVARKIAQIHRKPLATIDLGGGLGIPYFTNESPLDLEQLAKEANALFQPLADDHLFDGTRFIVEPGRFLVGAAGVYFASVLSIKESRGTRFVILDGGMNHHLAASGNLGQVIKRDFPIRNVSRPSAANLQPAVVVGPLCTPLDTLGRKVQLPETQRGDIVAVMQSGAYGLSASPIGFLSHPTPAEVLVADGAARIIRSRGNFGQTAPGHEVSLPTK